MQPETDAKFLVAGFEQRVADGDAGIIDVDTGIQLRARRKKFVAPLNVLISGSIALAASFEIRCLEPPALGKPPPGCKVGRLGVFFQTKHVVKVDDCPYPGTGRVQLRGCGRFWKVTAELKKPFVVEGGIATSSCLILSLRQRRACHQSSSNNKNPARVHGDSSVN